MAASTEHITAANDDERAAGSSGVTGAIFERLSRWRGARVLHPHGVTVRGRLEVGPGGGLPGTELFRPGRTTDAVVRLSRGVGLPPPWPDVLGIAVRAVDAYGTARHQDLLLVTALSVPGVRFVLVPAGSFDGCEYSSLLPSRVGGRRHLFGAEVIGPTPALVTSEDVARAAEAGTLRLRIRTATARAAWRDIATFTGTHVVPDGEGEAVRFDPWHTGGGIEPDGWVQRWRASAYPASQRGRPDT